MCDLDKFNLRTGVNNASRSLMILTMRNEIKVGTHPTCKMGCGLKDGFILANVNNFLVNSLPNIDYICEDR